MDENKKTYIKELMIILGIVILMMLLFLYLVPTMVRLSRMNPLAYDMYPQILKLEKENCLEKEGLFYQGGFGERDICIINQTKYEYYYIDNELYMLK